MMEVEKALSAPLAVPSTNKKTKRSQVILELDDKIDSKQNGSYHPTNGTASPVNLLTTVSIAEEDEDAIADEDAAAAKHQRSMSIGGSSNKSGGGGGNGKAAAL